MAKHNVKVVIPRNPEELILLANAIYQKHINDASESPLNALRDYNWRENGGKLFQIKCLMEEAKKLEEEIEKIYQKREGLMNSVKSTVRASRDLLLGAYKANYSKLKEWNFRIEETSKSNNGIDVSN